MTLMFRPRTAEAVLRLLDKFFTTPAIPSHEKRKLWDVLSALRGPDNESHEQKACTTALIRAAAFPKTATLHLDKPSGINRASGIPATFKIDDDDIQTARRAKWSSDDDHKPTRWEYHFYSHAKGAFDSLGLCWQHNNGDVRERNKEKKG